MDWRYHWDRRTRWGYCPWLGEGLLWFIFQTPGGNYLTSSCCAPKQSGKEWGLTEVWSSRVFTFSAIHTTWYVQDLEVPKCAQDGKKPNGEPEALTWRPRFKGQSDLQLLLLPQLVRLRGKWKSLRGLTEPAGAGTRSHQPGRASVSWPNQERPAHTATNLVCKCRQVKQQPGWWEMLKWPELPGDTSLIQTALPSTSPPEGHLARADSHSLHPESTSTLIGLCLCQISC